MNVGNRNMGRSAQTESVTGQQNLLVARVCFFVFALYIDLPHKANADNSLDPVDHRTYAQSTPDIIIKNSKSHLKRKANTVQPSRRRQSPTDIPE
jgi:hypothetical protein